MLEFVHQRIAHSCLVQRRIMPKREGDRGREEHHSGPCRHSEYRSYLVLLGELAQRTSGKTTQDHPKRLSHYQQRWGDEHEQRMLHHVDAETDAVAVIGRPHERQRDHFESGDIREDSPARDPPATMPWSSVPGDQISSGN